MPKQLSRLAVVALIAGACTDATSPSAPARLAPVAEIGANISTQVVPNEYIVVLRSGTVSAQAQVAAQAGAVVLDRWEHALKGYSARLSPEVLTALRRNPNVAYVEPNQTYTIVATQSPTPSWGLDRIDQKNLPLNSSYTYPTGGATVHAYILDTGIRQTHTEFAGRIGNSFDAVTSGGTANDCNGHGTHVAGTVGGTVYGVAKSSILHAVRVLDCSGSGSTSGVISGINWVTANKVTPAVANMSLGGGFSTSLNSAVTNSISGGITYALASGNSNANACNFSPASTPTAITVNSTTSTDARSSFSNFGTCTDIFAPGSSITSAWSTSDNATNTISGTSMATPHVAGAAALVLASYPAFTPAQVGQILSDSATANKVTNPGSGSPNKLLYMGWLNGGAPPPPPGNAPPVADFTYSCVPFTSAEGPRFRCTLDGSSSTDDVGVTSYTWTAPGRPTKTGVSTMRTYPSAGSYPNTLTVRDAGGLTNAITKTVVIP